MIHFQYVKYKNIFTYRQRMSMKLILDKHKSPLIVGENGAGKPTNLIYLLLPFMVKRFVRCPTHNYWSNKQQRIVR